MVYFIRNPGNGLIKIGCSNSPESRRVSLGREWRQSLESLGVINGGFKVERRTHQQFAHLQEVVINPKGEPETEWFRPEPDLMAFIDENAFTYCHAIETPSGRPFVDFLAWAGWSLDRFTPKEITDAMAPRLRHRVAPQRVGLQAKKASLSLFDLYFFARGLGVDPDEFLESIGYEFTDIN